MKPWECCCSDAGANVIVIKAETFNFPKLKILYDPLGKVIRLCLDLHLATGYMYNVDSLCIAVISYIGTNNG